MRSSGLDDFAATAEERVAELDDPQIGPGSRTPTNHRKQCFPGWPVGPRLCQDQHRRCRRAGYSGMAMDEEMGVPHLGQTTPEFEEKFDIVTLRRSPACARFDNVMEAQLEPLVSVEGAKGLWLWPARIKN